ncbi:alpha/beta hydrolase [Actinokineospora sp. 24-640]
MRAAALLAGVALAAAACTAGPSSRPAIVVQGDGSVAPTAEAPGPAEVPPLGEPGATSLRWSPCGPEISDQLAGLGLPESLAVECGRVTGVLDSPYAPNRGVKRMQVLRAGTGPVPVVVFNDVDGLPGTLYAAQVAARLPAEFLAEFSLVGVDRRGTGSSDAVRCVPERVRADLVGADPRAMRIGEWVDWARSAGQNCSIALEKHLPALDTWRTAADADAVRSALGMERLHAIGHGEGSRVLSVFAERYPGKVGRMVLDGLPDPDEDHRVVVTGMAAGAEATLDAFAEDCAARACPLGDAARQALSAVLDEASSLPLTAGGIDLTPGIVLRAVHKGLADQAAWPALAEAIAAARDGDGAALAGFILPTVLETEELAATFDGTLVVRCNDTKSRLATEQIEQTTRDLNSRYPVFGALAAQWLALCGPWPVPSKPVPQPVAKAAPPIVVLATAIDPVTPLEGTERAVQRLATAVGVSWQGAGHGALPASTCATEAALAFLRAGTVPRDGTVCPP